MIIMKMVSIGIITPFLSILVMSKYVMDILSLITPALAMNMKWSICTIVMAVFTVLVLSI